MPDRARSGEQSPHFADDAAAADRSLDEPPAGWCFAYAAIPSRPLLGADHLRVAARRGRRRDAALAGARDGGDRADPTRPDRQPVPERAAVWLGPKGASHLAYRRAKGRVSGAP